MDKVDGSSLLESDVTRTVIGGFFDAYNQPGRGFLESVYEGAMEVILTDAGLDVKRQFPIDVWFRGKRIGHFRADLVINNRLIVEIKRAKRLHSRHRAQVYNALKASQF